MKRATLALVVLACASRALAQDVPVVLEGPALHADFLLADNAPEPGTRLELRLLRNLLEPLPDVTLPPRSGLWTLRLQRTPDGSGAPPAWMDVSQDGTVTHADPLSPIGTLDSLALIDFQQPRDGITVQWQLTATVDGAPADLLVTTEWTLVAGQPLLDTQAHVTIVAGGPLPWHVAEVGYPLLRVDEYDGACGTDELLLPFAEGVIVGDPTEGPPGLDGNLLAKAASQPESQPLELTAYWDGCTPSRCFVALPTDGGRTWKRLTLQAEDGAPGAVLIGYHHLPEDIFTTTEWNQAAPIRLGVIRGDWWDAADLYRTFLATDPMASTWYRGPVGSPANPLPAVAKELVAEVFLFNQYTGDNLDLFARQALDIWRIVGDNFLATYYGGHAPDHFGDWFFEGGYLPGRPSFAASVREGQKQFNELVMPYVQSSTVADCADPALFGDTCDDNEVLAETQAAAVLDESLQPVIFPSPTGAPRSLFPSLRSPWWQQFFPQHTASIATFTGALAVYLDFFLTLPDYNPLSTGPGQPPPGGGSWMFTRRLQQLADLRAAMGPDFVITLEAQDGPFTAEADLMHGDPASVLLPGGLGFPPEGGPVLVTQPAAQVVPLFRAIFDNVKMARIVGADPYSDPGQRAWAEAVSVFTFGRIPSFSWSFSEIDSPVDQRFPFADYYAQLGGPDVSHPIGTPPGGDCERHPSSGPGFFGTTCHFEPKPVAGFHRALTGMADALRRGFLTWHNGTLRRLPQYEVTAPPSFDGAATVDPDLTDGVRTVTPVYLEQLPDSARFLVPGMYEAPADSPDPDLAGTLAFVLCNPWPLPAADASMQATFTFDPAQYPGWSDTTVYTVTAWNHGKPMVSTSPRSGDYTVVDVTVAPATIRWWVFKKL